MDVSSGIQEYCHDGGAWYKNNLGVQAAPLSNLSVITRNLNIRLYYQPADIGAIKEWCLDTHGGWFEGASLRAIAGDTSKSIDINGSTGRFKATYGYIDYKPADQGNHLTQSRITDHFRPGGTQEGSEQRGQREGEAEEERDGEEDSA